jgi:hypothetical protein
VNVNADIGLNPLAATVPPVPVHPRIITKPRIAMSAVINARANVGICDTTDQPELQAEQDE